MEYEILDDPQGETETREARRDGGIDEDGFMLRAPREGDAHPLQREKETQLA